MPARKKSEFQVHGLAAARKQPKKKTPEPAPVKVIRANPAALKIAHDRAQGRDVHLVFLEDGSIEIRNGKRE